MTTEIDSRYCQPNDAGLGSTGAAVGRKIGKLFDALDVISSWRAHGQIIEDCYEFKMSVRKQLEAEGWRIKASARDNWQVLPPIRTGR